jgi:hypothetical protein
MLEDVKDLAQAVAEILAGAQDADVAPAAVTSLTAAVRALDAGADTSYDAGSQQERRPGGGHGSDAAMTLRRDMPVRCVRLSILDVNRFGIMPVCASALSAITRSSNRITAAGRSCLARRCSSSD